MYEPASSHDPREDGTLCQGCGERYKVDLTLPDHLWSRAISQYGVPYNLLCPVCIAVRIENLGQFDHYVLTKGD